jgi:hypothetical protein
MADPRIETTSTKSPVDDPVDVSYHLVPFPDEVGFASISCSSTAGTVRLSYTAAGEPATLTFQPNSPIYNIQNPSCAGNVVVPLGRADGKPQVAVLTFDNNRKQLPSPDPAKDAGIICVVVALSFPAANKQEKVLVKRKLMPGDGTTVHVVFSPA